MQKMKIPFHHPKLIPRKEASPDPNAAFVLNRGGVVVGMKKENGKERIYYIDEDSHLMCIGATRSGKSR